MMTMMTIDLSLYFLVIQVEGKRHRLTKVTMREEGGWGTAVIG